MEADCFDLEEPKKLGVWFSKRPSNYFQYGSKELVSGMLQTMLFSYADCPGEIWNCKAPTSGLMQFGARQLLRRQ
ncbi:hypothetical protein MKX03_004679 [Papaver bracteatum]|nr:hypothetical protein MKX03_004679 [Papaver bracteatum]